MAKEPTREDILLKAATEGFEKALKDLNSLNYSVTKAIASAKSFTGALVGIGKTVAAYSVRLKDFIKPIYEFTNIAPRGVRDLNELNKTVQKLGTQFITLKDAAELMTKFMTKSFTNFYGDSKIKENLTLIQRDLQRYLGKDAAIDLIDQFMAPFAKFADAQDVITQALKDKNYAYVEMLADMKGIPIQVSRGLTGALKEKENNPWIRLYESLSETTQEFKSKIAQTMIDFFGEKKLTDKIESLMKTAVNQFRIFLEYVEKNKGTIVNAFNRVLDAIQLVTNQIKYAWKTLDSMPNWIKEYLIGGAIAHKITGGASTKLLSDVTGAGVKGIVKSITKALGPEMTKVFATSLSASLATGAVLTAAAALIADAFEASKGAKGKNKSFLGFEDVVDNLWGGGGEGGVPRHYSEADPTLNTERLIRKREESAKRDAEANSKLAATQKANEDYEKGIKDRNAQREKELEDINKTIRLGTEAYKTQSEIAEEMTSKAQSQAEIVRLTGKGQKELADYIERSRTANKGVIDQGKELIKDREKFIAKLREQAAAEGLTDKEREDINKKIATAEKVIAGEESKIHQQQVSNLQKEVELIKARTADQESNLRLLGSQKKVQQEILGIVESVYGSPAVAAEQLKSVLAILEQERLEAQKILEVRLAALETAEDEREARVLVAEAQADLASKTREQVELSKRVRDAYLDAVKSQQIGIGFFSKLLLTREANVGMGQLSGAVKKNYMIGQRGQASTAESVRMGMGGFVTGSGRAVDERDQQAREATMSAQQREMARLARKGDVFRGGFQKNVTDLTKPIGAYGGAATSERAAGLSTTREGLAKHVGANAKPKTRSGKSDGAAAKGEQVLTAMKEFVDALVNRDSELTPSKANSNSYL